MSLVFRGKFGDGNQFPKTKQTIRTNLSERWGKLDSRARENIQVENHTGGK